MRYQARGRPPQSRDRERAGSRPRAPRSASITCSIATELRDPEADPRAHPRPHRARPPPRAPPPIRRAPPLERELAELWAGLLNVPAVGIHDNFFDLGGHSLLAVQLLSRVRQIYGVDLSLEVVYSGEFTVAELAKAIELKEIEQAGGDYQDLVRGTRRPHRRRGARAAGRRAGCELTPCASC